ncbi:MAG TPA: transcription termination factor Rho [Pseudonocardiaceae bacterium]|nr:transcription termination factor Rho [Pseudonocardiaceae bacterium]
MSDINLLGNDVPAAASSDPQPVEHDVASSDNGTVPRRRTGLSGMVVADLRKLAGQLGISNPAGFRKNDLISAIKERQNAVPRQRRADADQLPLEGTVSQPERSSQPESTVSQPERTAPQAEVPAASHAGAQTEVHTGQQTGEPQVTSPAPTTGDQQERDTDGMDRSRNRRRRPPRAGDAPRSQGSQIQRDQTQRDQTQSSQTQTEQAPSEQTPSEQTRGGQNGIQSAGGQNGARDDDDEGGRRRGRRFRDRNRRNRPERGSETRRDGGELEVREDDVLLPVAGILDVLDNYAFVRTSGYLSGPNDVYVSLSLVRKHWLRRGDAITGAVRQPRDGEQQRQKFNPLVRVDTINGLDVELAKQRPEFTKMTPLYPNERLRLETEQHLMTTRVIDLVMPIGKGQRALIVSPPKAGKTMILQALANAITTNNPECHLMVVLVDERPEEVTDMQRSVKGEVIASTFDRPPSDHTSISELAIERAKRLVEMGHDVVVLLDSITRLGRAYNLAAPASGRILSGGVDSTALYPPKRFLGAARNIEDGGSLTIFATALVETGSTMDTVIFEEFKGTGNAELKLDRKIADKRIFPAIDVNPSGTRKEELLLSPDELAIHHKLRRVLTGLESQQAIDLLLDRLRKTRTNIEFLMSVSKSAAGNGSD